MKHHISAMEIRPLKETGDHSYHRRAFNHDYFAPFIYHIILKKAPGSEPFGAVDGDARIAHGNQGAAIIRESNIGKIIAKCILHLPYERPILKLHQFCVMPDHVHLLIQVQYQSEQHLDFYIESLKQKIASKSDTDEEAIFAPGYCDKPLYDSRSLNGLYRYIRENPHRLAMRKQYPQFFQRTRKLKIGDKEYEAYGNLFLLRNPDKEAVKISRKFSPQEVERKKSGWVANAAQGTVLVSPFISKAEKTVRAEAELVGGKVILITHEAFADRFKPAAHDFELCEQGHLLIISLGMPPKTELSRHLCLRMNELARTIESFEFA